MKQTFRSILACLMLFLISCKTAQVQQPITDFPIKPELTHYVTPPVIKKIDDTYIVHKNLVNNSVLLTDYYKRIEGWKEVRNIR